MRPTPGGVERIKEKISPLLICPGLGNLLHMPSYGSHHDPFTPSVHLRGLLVP